MVQLKNEKKNIETSSQIFPLILQVVVGLLQFSISTVTLVVYVPFLRSFTIYIHVKLSSLVSILFTQTLSD